MILFDTNAAVQSLYIHWPFCPYRCNFCPFIALAGHDQYMERYHKALKQEIIAFAQARESTLPIRTIFMGGGTPSTYPVELLLDMYDTLNSVLDFDVAQNREITIEVNPGTVNQEKLETWKQVGINRLSVGVQSLNTQVLQSLNRHQKVSDVYMILDEGSKRFDNLSIDLILGLPGISPDEWKELVFTVVTWPIKHVSMYFLTVHEDTPLYFGIKQQKVILPSDDTIVELYYWTIEQFAKHGLHHYEISSFARPGFQARHNSMYWHRKPYKGVGLGACSFDGITRFQNEKNLISYLEGIEQSNNVTTFCEKLTDKQIWLEVLMLGLRQNRGVALSDVTASLSDKQKNQFDKTLDDLLQAKLLRCEQDRLILNPAGLAVVNGIIVKLSSMQEC